MLIRKHNLFLINIYTAMIIRFPKNKLTNSGYTALSPNNRIKRLIIKVYRGDDEHEENSSCTTPQLLYKATFLAIER
jgi:hypothetical protein